MIVSTLYKYAVQFFYSYEEVVMSLFVIIVLVVLVGLFAVLSLLPVIFKDSELDSLVQHRN